jgi:SAM-dependent methyltransferase
LLNLGCGNRFHPDWINVDLFPGASRVRQHDLRKPLPFPDQSFEAVYHSHVLEHLPRAAAPGFLGECYRVLVPGGVLRVVVPDLESIARLYLQSLEGAVAGDPQAAQRYDWMVLELLDQLVREQSGGEMRRYWQQQPMPVEEFVLQRMGQEVRQVLDELRRMPREIPSAPRNPAALLQFQQSGELHRWMYDRYSLGRLLAQSGFVGVRVCAAQESAIPDFNRYGLDLSEDGSVRKPDSLFMEATRP